MELKNDVISEGSSERCCSAKDVEIFSYLLGSALRHENPSKFLEIYERIPRHYTQELVEEIKEESRLIGELSEYDFQMLSQKLNCSRPDNKDIYISPAMSDNEVNVVAAHTTTTVGTLTRNKTRNSSQGSKDSSTASVNEVSDIINNNDSAGLHTAKLFQKTGDLNMTVVAIAAGKNEAMLPASFVDGDNPRKDSQSSGIYESCDDTTASAAQKTSKSRKKKKRNKAKRQALMAASGMSEQEVFDTVKENRLTDGSTGAGGGGDDSTSTSSCLNNLSGNHSLKSTLSSSTDTVSPSSIHNISPVVTTNDDIRNNQQNNNNNRHQNQQQQIHNLKANVPDNNRTHHYPDPAPKSPSKSSSNLPRNIANHDPDIHNSLPIHDLQDCDQTDSRLAENTAGFVCDDYEDSFYNAEEFQEVKRKSRNGARNVMGSQHYQDGLYSRKSAVSGTSKQMSETGFRNGIVSPIESINSSNSSLNAPSSASGSQTIPSNGAKPQREPDLHSYANRLKSSLQQNSCSNNQRNSNPTSNEQQQKQSSKPQNLNNSSSNQHVKSVDAKGAAVALPKNSLKRPNSNNEQSTSPNSKAQVKTPTKNYPNETMSNCNNSISPTSSESNLSSRKNKNTLRQLNRRSCENLVEVESKIPARNLAHEESFEQAGCNADNNHTLSFQFDENNSRITNNNDPTSNCLESISKQTNNVELKEGTLVTETTLYNSNQESASNSLLTTLNNKVATVEKPEPVKTELTNCSVPLDITGHSIEPISQNQKLLNHGEPTKAVNPQAAAERLRNEATEIPVSVEMPYMKSEASGHSLPLATFGGDVYKTGQLSTGCSVTGTRTEEPGSQHHQMQLSGEGGSGKRKYQEYGRGGSKVGQLMFGNLDINDEELNRFGVGDFDLFQATSLLAKTWNAWSSRESKDKEWFKLAEDCSRASSSCAEATASSSVSTPSNNQ